MNGNLYYLLISHNKYNLFENMVAFSNFGNYINYTVGN